MPRGAWLAIVCALAALLGGQATPAGAQAGRRLLWGANVGPQLTGQEAPWDMSAVSKFASMVNKPLSLVHFGSPFADCSTSPCSFYPFPTGAMADVRSHGAIPLLSWSSVALQMPSGDADFRLSEVISGRYDSYIRSFALGAKRWGHPFFLRFDWEMNGNWFPWSEGVNGNTSGQYVAAWRHVHDIFASVAAFNASWVWCPNVDPRREWTSLGELYPGDAYVDWTCLDGYNWGTSQSGPGRWESFDQLFRSTYEEIVRKIAPSKPMMIGEIASTEEGGSKAAWITNTLSELPTRYPKVHGLLWFERYDSNMDWPLETSSDALSAFARGVQSPAYASNTYANLDTSPIPAPGSAGGAKPTRSSVLRAHARHRAGVCGQQADRARRLARPRVRARRMVACARRPRRPQRRRHPAAHR